MFGPQKCLVATNFILAHEVHSELKIQMDGTFWMSSRIEKVFFAFNEKQYFTWGQIKVIKYLCALQHQKLLCKIKVSTGTCVQLKIVFRQSLAFELD